MDVTELHDEENLLVQMQDRWENYGSLDAIVDTHDPFTLEGAPRFELRLSKIIEKNDTFYETIITHSSAVTVAQHLWAGIHEPRTSWLPRRSKRVPCR